MQLTPRQRDVLKAVTDGLNCPQIARRLKIAVPTVRQHIRDLAAKIPDDDRPALMRVRANAGKLSAA